MTLFATVKQAKGQLLLRKHSEAKQHNLWDKWSSGKRSRRTRHWFNDTAQDVLRLGHLSIHGQNVRTFVHTWTRVLVVKKHCSKGCSTSCELLIVERPKVTDASVLLPGLTWDRLPNGFMESFASSSIFYACNFYISDFSDSLLITDAGTNLRIRSNPITRERSRI
jgi:hypothetical protein